MHGDVLVQPPPQPEAFPVPDQAAWPKVKLTPKRLAFERAMLFLHWVSEKRRPAPIAWDLTWFPTYLCNLKCWYCNAIYGKADMPNPEKAVDKIIALHPASISILGGEPFIVKGMVDHIRRIREALPKCFIMVTTNGMVKSDHIAQTVPLINSLCFSIDGEGEYQERPRGGDSETILSNLKVAQAARVKQNPDMDLVVNTVVSKYNALHLPAFFRKIHTEVSPTILGFCQALMPFDAEHSIGSAPEVVREFTRQMTELKKEMRILIVGQLANEQTRDQNRHEVDEEKIETRFGGCKTFRCHQERFYVHITPSGRTYSCANYAGINEARDKMLGMLHEKQYMTALKTYAAAFYKWAIKPPTFDCTEFRGCPEWAEDIMKLRTDSKLPELFRVSGRLTEAQLLQSVQFIHRHVNPEFEAALIKDMRRPGHLTV